MTYVFYIFHLFTNYLYIQQQTIFKINTSLKEQRPGRRREKKINRKKPKVENNQKRREKTKRKKRKIASKNTN